MRLANQGSTDGDYLLCRVENSAMGVAAVGNFGTGTISYKVSPDNGVSLVKVRDITSDEIRRGGR